MRSDLSDGAVAAPSSRREAPPGLPPRLSGGKTTLLHAGRNRSKGNVWLVQTAEGPAVLKDITACPFWVKHLFARRLLAREARAYEALSGLGGVPSLLEAALPDQLVLTWIDGTPLPRLPRERLGEELFDRLDTLLSAIHARGVACGDVHHRNVLVTTDGTPNLVDFALAAVRGDRDGAWRRWTVRRLMELDDGAAVRMRLRYLRRPPTGAEREIMGRGAGLWRMGRMLKRLLRPARSRGSGSGS